MYMIAFIVAMPMLFCLGSAIYRYVAFRHLHGHGTRVEDHGTQESGILKTAIQSSKSPAKTSVAG